MNGPTQYVLTIVPVKGVAPEIVRLRHILKALLRHHGFRCVDIAEVIAPAPAPPAPGDAHAWLGWALVGGAWKAIAHGATAEEARGRLDQATTVETTVLAAGEHPARRQHVADGAGQLSPGN